MQLWQTIAIIVVVAAVLGIGWSLYVQRRRQHLRDHFGPEYDRAVTEIGNQREAEAELAQRENRVRNLNIRPLNPPEGDTFRARWKSIQSQFVDDPAGAVHAADSLVNEIMKTRGYAFDHPDQRMSDISAAYPQQAGEYRAACAAVVALRNGEASTELLRTAFVHYRALFNELIGDAHEELRRVS